MVVVLTVLEMLGRATLVAALLAVPRDGRAAVVIAMVAAFSTAIRAALRGKVMARELRRAWAELLSGIRGQGLETLLVNREDLDRLATVILSVREVAALRGTLIPSLVGQTVTLAAVAVFATVRFPGWWLVAGAVIAVPLAALSRLSRRAQMRAEIAAADQFVGIDRDVRALVGARLELRAHAAEGALSTEVQASAARMAAFERRTLELSASLALVPCAVAATAAVIPSAWLAGLAERSGWLDVGVVSISGLTLAMSIAGGLESLARAAPYRAAFHRTAAASRTLERRINPDRDGIASLTLRSVSLTYPEAADATPHRLDLHLARGGTVLVGPNGSGKSSAILLALGFVDPSAGDICVNGKPLTAERRTWLRSRTAYVPQRSYVVPTESLAWHARLGGVQDGPALLETCRRMGLEHRLRVSQQTGCELDLPMGSLSGGERQRFLIARALARRADVLILDEPEVGLDARGREDLRAVLESEALERIVLLVAHDPTVAPNSFHRVTCSRESRKSEAEVMLC